MIDRKAFARGFGVVALQLGQALDQPKVDAYYAALFDETDPEQWFEFCAVAAKRRGWRFLPGVTELLDALREFRGEPRLDSEAADAYERVLESGEYNPEGGTRWNYRAVLARCGRAAAEAFLAAGGHSAFATTWDESKRRERFTAAYQTEAREVPANRLLPPAPMVDRPLLVGNVELAGDVARSVLRQIDTLAQESGAIPKPHPTGTTLRPLTQSEWDARVAALREQGREIVGADGNQSH